jgi:hypothetical protein
MKLRFLTGARPKKRDVLEASMIERSESDGRSGELYGDLIAYGGSHEQRLIIRRQLIGSAVIGLGVALLAGLVELTPANSDRSTGGSPHLWVVQQPVFTQPPEEHIAGLKR